MAFDVSLLANYTKENEGSLIATSLLRAKTQEMIRAKGNILSDVKSSININIMDTDAVFQVGGTCAFTPSGTTSFSRRLLTVGKIKVHESLCPKTLEAKYTQLALQRGSQPESIPFEAEYTQRKAEKIAKQLEIAIWKGDTASGDANLNKFDGFLKLLDASGVAINGNTGGVTAATGITTTNVNDIFDAAYSAIPTELLDADDLIFWTGWDTFRKLVMSLKNANMYHYDGVKAVDGEITLPGTNVKIVAVNGLNGTNRIIAARLSNMYIGTDVLGEEDQFEIFYAKEAMEVRFVAEWKMGVQWAFPQEVTQFTLVP